MSALTIAAAQFAPTDSPTDNLATVDGFAEQAADAGAAVLVTPEYTSFFAQDLDDRFVDAAEPLDGPFVSGLRRIAEQRGIALVVGVAERSELPGRFRNTLVAIDRTGEVVATYRKVHLYDAFGARESDRIEAGDTAQLPVFTLDDVRFGLETCYDLRFPEVTRRLAIAGADVVLLPAEWVRGPGKEHHWRTLLTARAIENTLWVVGAGQTPPIGVGGSLVVDPGGVAVAGLGAEVGMLTARVDTDVIARVRNVNPSLALRRYEIAERAAQAADTAHAADADQAAEVGRGSDAARTAGA